MARGEGRAEVAEHELKFVFSARQANTLIQWLKKRCQEDGEHPVNIISSVYYDTVDWNFLQEKINSDYLKTKFRLRWYQDRKTREYSSLSYFEKKQKVGSSRKKVRQAVVLDDAVKFAKDLNNPYFISLPRKMFSPELSSIRTIVPVFQISYVRHRFIDRLTGARLAVDYDISVPRTNPGMVKTRKITALSSGVFECKSSLVDLPDWLHGITLFGCRKGAFSKYSQCYAHITALPF